MNDPKMPSKKTQAEHDKTHLPFASWCRHCVRGKGQEMSHQKQKPKDKDMTMKEFHFDWAFPGDEEGKERLNVLVGKLRDWKMTLSSVFPGKTSNDFVT